MANRWRSFLLGSLLCLLLGGCSSPSSGDGTAATPNAPAKAEVSVKEEEASPYQDSAAKKTEKPFRPASTHLRGKDPFLH